MGGPEQKTLHCFGEFLLDKSARTLTRNGGVISLTPKEFETLVLLVDSAGEAVEREHLVRSVWPDTFVGDTSLARNISALRKHLGADAIQTVPKFGYRFCLPVTFVAANGHLPLAQSSSTVQAPAAQDVTLSTRSDSRRLRLWLAVAGLITLAAFAGAWLLMHRRLNGESRSPRLAVLPFRNISEGSTETDYLRDGLAEELTSHLSRLDYKKLRVLARGSTEQYLNTRKPPAIIASELGARYLLDGTVSFDQGQVHLTIELINGPDQTILWSGQLSRPTPELPALEEDIVESVAKSIGVGILSEGKSAQLPGDTSSAEAHDAYLQGRYLLEQKIFASELQALERFHFAVKLDPSYSRAYEGISQTYIYMAGFVLPQRPFANAKDAALTAIRINDNLGEAHRDLAWAVFNGEADLEGAEIEYRRAIELNPDDARAHHWYSQLLAAERRSSESMLEATAGYQLDPRSIGSGYNYGFMLIEAGDSQAGIQVLQNLLKRDPTSDVIWGYLGIGYARLHEFAKSANAFEQAATFSDIKVGYQAATAYALAMNGEKENAQLIVQDLEKKSVAGTWIPGEAMTVAYIGLGDQKQAFEWLQKGVQDRSVSLLEANTDPIYSAFSGDPRFSQILLRLGARKSRAQQGTTISRLARVRYTRQSKHPVHRTAPSAEGRSAVVDGATKNEDPHLSLTL